MDWTVRCSNPGRYKRFLFSPNVQTNLEAHPSSYSKGTEIFFPGGEVDRLPPSSAVLKNELSLTSTPICIYGADSSLFDEVSRSYLIILNCLAIYRLAIVRKRVRSVCEAVCLCNPNTVTACSVRPLSTQPSATRCTLLQTEPALTKNHRESLKSVNVINACYP